MRCAAEPAERFPSGSLRHRPFGGTTALGIPDSLGLTLSGRRADGHDAASFVRTRPTPSRLPFDAWRPMQSVPLDLDGDPRAAPACTLIVGAVVVAVVAVVAVVPVLVTQIELRIEGV